MIAYFDCFSGASGDMILGALVDAGLPLEALKEGLSSLSMAEEFNLSAETVMRGALRATLVKVDTSHHHHGHHHHRGLTDIREIIQSSSLDEAVQEKSLAIFQRLAMAEGRVHGMPAEKVHFHEVGAVDSIVDIVGATWGLEKLGVRSVYASSLPLAGGQIESSHGTLPLPAPATMELLTMGGAPTHPWQGQKELVTPTGAAILTTLASFSQPVMRLQRLGVGAGGRDLPWPNILRLWLGEAVDGGLYPQTPLSVLETNIDNMNPELFGHVMARLFEAGALDVYYTPIFMKKNRPATMLSVIAHPEDEARLAELILRETTTLGVRTNRYQRYELDRQIQQVETPYGPIAVKVKIIEGKVVSAAPEYESCRQLAVEKDVPLSEIYLAVHQAALSLISLTVTTPHHKEHEEHHHHD